MFTKRIILLISAFLVWNVALAQDVIITDIKKISTEQEFGKPKWSPNGKQILVSPINHKGLFIIDIKSGKTQKVRGFEGIAKWKGWTKDGKNIFFNEKTGPVSLTKILNIEDSSIKVLENIFPEPRFAKRLFNENSDTVVFLNLKKLSIEGISTITKSIWAITTEVGRFYNPILSPDMKMVSVSNQGNIQIYSTDGSGILHDVGRGIASAWAPNSKNLLFFATKDDGYYTTESELYIFNTETKTTHQLTQSPEKIEMWPDWSIGNNIIFSDEKTGSIFTGTLQAQ